MGFTRRPNSEYRTREHLIPAEIAALINAARSNRYGERDATMLLVAYRHGLRASEVCGLQWSQIDFATAMMHVTRKKNGKASTHPIRGDELEALRQLRERATSKFVFISERGTPYSIAGYNKLVKRTGCKAGLSFAIHSHMLTEQPRLIFLHFWANDDALKLAKGLRAALDKTASVTN